MRSHLLASATLVLACISACKPSTSTPAGTSAGTPGNAAQAGATPQAAQQAPATQQAAAAGGRTFTGSVAETMNSGGYTYLHLTNGSADVWAAAPEFDAKVGEQVSVSLDMPMQGFQSKTLNRTFPLLYFVQEVGRNGQTAASPARGPSLMNSHGTTSAESSAASAPPAVETIPPPAGGLSVADVFAKKASLSGKTVAVRGQVVKFNGGIMDRNWLHIQDGSGSAGAKNNDLTVTTDATVKVGDVVTVSGVLGTDKDFGAGYAYDAILEKATIAR
jgi:hypothetical protein